jgi:hypothetical protein
VSLRAKPEKGMTKGGSHTAGGGTSAGGYEHEPSSQETLEARQSAEAPVEPADDPTLSPEQRAWEELLRRHLGDFYYPRYVAAKRKSVETAWDYVRDDPGLPRALIIGDSISRGYTLAVRHALAGKVNVHRAPENCGKSENALERLTIWLGDGHWHLVTFNFGIHDRETPDAVYREHLQWIVDRLRPAAEHTLWVTSTPVPGTAPEHRPGSVERLNRIAAALMDAHGIPVLDLYSHVWPHLERYQLPDNCHFKEEGYGYLGRIVADRIQAELGTRLAS